ncbi:hypothetical protein CDAR_607811 [Caerostris darwini]|uniref:Uncharacterized protein n=1 Tax=Caerostris darwini TaxID=1538125 RepID=A0AAV4UL90_9ARAC|nr:hypothetical protein CDAR_607811 [Caerostris darwini]
MTRDCGTTRLCEMVITSEGKNNMECGEGHNDQNDCCPSASAFNIHLSELLVVRLRMTFSTRIDFVSAEDLGPNARVLSLCHCVSVQLSQSPPVPMATTTFSETRRRPSYYLEAPNVPPSRDEKSK